MARAHNLAFDLKAPPALSEKLVKYVLMACASVSIISTIGIVAVLLFESLQFFGKVSLSLFLGDTQWSPLFAQQHWGIWPLVSGTLLTSGIAIAVALPLGLLGAIYLAEL